MAARLTPIAAIALFLMLLTLGCNKPGDEQEQPIPPVANPGAVKGRIINEFNRLLPDAVVRLQGNRVDTSMVCTDGQYIFSSLAAGSYKLLVNKAGYIEASASVIITAADTVTKDVSLKAGTAYFTLLSDSVITAKPFAKSYAIKIGSNSAWEISSGNDWIQPEKASGSGDDSVIVRVVASTVDTVRQGTVVLQSGSLLKKIIIRQLPEVKLKSVIPLPGNLALGIRDSIALVFNQPVTIKAIFPGNKFCESEIRFTASGDTLTFSYGCAELGGDYPFTITTNNALGDQYSFAFTASFYGKSTSMPGFIVKYFVNEADNSYWIITRSPNALYKIDMTSLKVLLKQELPQEPAMITVSPYNNKIYIGYARNTKLYVLNQDGTTDQVIDINPNPTRKDFEADGSRLVPFSLAFTKSGKGMIWCSKIDQGGLGGFWFIDAAADHKVWYQPLPNEAMYFNYVRANHDQTKLVLTGAELFQTCVFFDGQKMNFTQILPVKVDDRRFVLPNRKNDNLYIRQSNGQSILNPVTGVESRVLVNMRQPEFQNVDFNYKPGKENSIYIHSQNILEVLDFTMGKSPIGFDTIFFLYGLTNTLDGKYVLVHWGNGNGDSRVIQFPSEWFAY